MPLLEEVSRILDAYSQSYSGYWLLTTVYFFFMFELFIARRYLRAKRKQVVISVITVISVAGVAAGVMALVIALAVNNGFRNSLEHDLLGATAHVSILERNRAKGFKFGNGSRRS